MLRLDRHSPQTEEEKHQENSRLDNFTVFELYVHTEQGFDDFLDRKKCTEGNIDI